jgi:hypothetical protein
MYRNTPASPCLQHGLAADLARDDSFLDEEAAPRFRVS